MISIALAVILILFGLLAFFIPFRNGIITNRYKAIIDNSVFRLHYRLTFGFLLAMSIFLSATTLMEEPMDQIADGDLIWPLIANSCVIHNPHNFSDVPLGNTYERSHGLNETIYEQKPALMYYYQVLTLCLFVQAILFVLPFKLWSVLECGVTQSMINTFHSAVEKSENGVVSGREKLVLKLLRMFSTIPNKWFYCLVATEIVNFINVFGQLFFVNSLFNGDFIGEHLPFFRANVSNWFVECNHVALLPMRGLSTICFFQRDFVPDPPMQFSGSCKFPRTTMDEKFYLFITFWLMYISVLSGIILICRFLIVFSPRVRSFWTRSRVNLSHPECYEFIFRKSSLGGWFLFDMLCKNLQEDEFNDVVNDFAKKLEGKKFAKPVENYM